MTTNEKFTTDVKRKLLHEFLDDIGAGKVRMMNLDVLQTYIRSEEPNRKVIEALFPELSALEELRWILVAQMAKGPNAVYPMSLGGKTYEVTITVKEKSNDR